MDREGKIKFILDNIMDSAEVIVYLDITKPRLSDMKKTEKLIPIKKGIYLKEDVEERKREQESLRIKFGPK